MKQTVKTSSGLAGLKVKKNTNYRTDHDLVCAINLRGRLRENTKASGWSEAQAETTSNEQRQNEASQIVIYIWFITSIHLNYSIFKFEIHSDIVFMTQCQ